MHRRSYLLSGYVGSKAPHCQKIRAFFDFNCKKYIEPFAGGASIYFSIPNGRYEKEWLNDRNPNIAIMYSALSEKNTHEETVKRILAIQKPDDETVAKEQFARASSNILNTASYNVLMNDNLKRERIIDIAVSTYLVFSQSFNKTGQGYSDLISNERYSWMTRDRIINSTDRLRTLDRVTNVDSLSIIRKKADDSEVQFYLDPPYVGVCRLNKSRNYLVDMIDLRSHYLLAESLRDSKAAVVLSGYRALQQGVPTIYDAVLGEDWHCFAIGNVHNNAVISAKGKRKPVMTEYIWTNRVPENAKYYVSLQDYKESLTVTDYLERIKEAIESGLIKNKRDIKDYSAFENWYMSEVQKTEPAEMEG